MQTVKNSCQGLELLDAYDRAQGSVQQRLHSAAEQLSDSAMRELALRFAHRFGTASAELQLESLHAMELQCQHELERQQEKAVKDGSLALSLGMLGGATLAVLLL